MVRIGTTGTYHIMIDASLIPSTEVEKRLCLRVRDGQGTRTVADEILCQDIDKTETYCDISASTSGTEFTISSCIDEDGSSITLATDMFVGSYMIAYTNGSSQCNVVGQGVFVSDFTAGVVAVKEADMPGS